MEINSTQVIIGDNNLILQLNVDLEIPITLPKGYRIIKDEDLEKLVEETSRKRKFEELDIEDEPGKFICFAILIIIMIFIIFRRTYCRTYCRNIRTY